MNELLLITSLVIIFSSILLFYYLFGDNGLYVFTCIATITANIEVMILVNAFGMEQALGNILFASTFLVTDILSEVSGKKAANRCVNLGILTSLSFMLISQSWLLYTPSASDWAQPSIRAIFSNTPRLMFASFIVYAICQRFDVWAYHQWWTMTTRLCGDARRFLWLRNNGSTMISQLLNTILYTFGAFWGRYELHVLFSIIASSYAIFIVTSIADTPFVYLARKLAPRVKARESSASQTII